MIFGFQLLCDIIIHLTAVSSQQNLHKKVPKLQYEVCNIGFLFFTNIFRKINKIAAKRTTWSSGKRSWDSSLK